MKFGEALFYLGVIIACAIYLITACTTVSLGALAAPGPGLLPAILAGASIFLAAILFTRSLKALLAAGKDDPRVFTPAFVHDPAARKKALRVAAFCASIGAYLALFELVNFLLLTFVLMFILGKLFGMKGWLKPLLLALIFVAAVYLIFIVGFQLHI